MGTAGQTVGLLSRFVAAAAAKAPALGLHRHACYRDEKGQGVERCGQGVDWGRTGAGGPLGRGVTGR